MAADQQQLDTGHLFAQERHQALRRPFRGIDIGLVTVAADEGDRGALYVDFDDVARLDGPGDDLHVDAGGQLGEQLRLGCRMHDHAIDEEHRTEFEPPHLLGFLAQYRIVLDLCLALEAQEVEIGDAVEDARFGEMLADHAAIFRRVRITVQVHQIKRLRPLAEHVLDREVIRVIEALDPTALQFRRVGVDLGHVIAGDERHLIAEALQGQDVLKGGVGAGVLIRLGH